MPPQPLTVAGRPAIAPPQVATPPASVTPAVTAPPQSSTGGLDPRAILAAKAIRQVESGGNYSASGKSGEYGAYQFEPSTWDAAAPQYGINVPLSQATREQQNEVAVKTINSWITSGKATNIGQVASMWNAGEGKPNAYLDGNKGVNSKGVSYDTAAYAKNVALAYHALKSGQTDGSQQTQPNAPSAPSNPDATTAPAPQKGLLSSASDLINTLFPNKNIGEAVGTELDKLFPSVFIPKNPVTGKSDSSYVAPSTATVGSITGDLLGDAAWLVGGGEAAPAIEEASTLGRIVPAALQGAKAGAIAGGLGGAGNALSNNGTLGDALTGGLEGAGIGALTGGVLSGGLSALPGVAGRVANGGIQSESGIAGDLTRGNLGNDQPFNTKNFTSAASKFGKNAQATEDTIGAITQASEPEDRAAATAAFQDVDTSGKIPVYSVLSSRVQDAIDKNQSIVDKEHSTNTTPVKLKDLGQKISVNVGATSKLSRTVNYVKDGISQLKDFYNKTGDVENALRMSALEKKATTTGLTSSEINGLAREHGRVLNGYNANGELASGLKKQAAENTRTGIKTTARGFLSSDAAKLADQKTSALIKLKGQLDDVQKGINNLANKVEKRGIIKKIAGKAASGINFATGGAPKAFFQKLFLESNIGNKSGNYMDFEERLQRNLKILNRLNGSTDSDVEKFLRNLIGGLVQKR